MPVPVKPHWPQPSHPDIQEVIVNDTNFSTKSVSKVELPAFALFAKLSFPPCTMSSEASYATVQIDHDKHIDLNSDLLYLNHSCEPSLEIDTEAFEIRVGPNGLRAGDELTFFYPSTEWEMAQPFQCNCESPSCRGLIKGAKDMTRSQLEGMWLNSHIRKSIGKRSVTV